MPDTEPTRSRRLAKDHHRNVSLVADAETIDADTAESGDRAEHASTANAIVFAKTGTANAVVAADTGPPDAVAVA